MGVSETPSPIYQCYAQCRGTESVLRTLAHLLAAQTHATPKQAKEPIIATQTENY